MTGTANQRALGRTLALDDIDQATVIGVDLVLNSGDHGVDLVMATGTEALAQDLKVAMLTPRGEDVFHQHFGFEGLNALSRNGGVRFTEELLRLATMQTVESDARIDAVERVDVVRVDPSTRAWRIDVVARTVTNQQLVLTLGEVNGHA